MAPKFLLLPFMLLSFLPPASEALAQPSVGKDLGTMSGEEIAALVREITPEVEKIRGLKFDKPVAVEIVDDAEARSHIEARIAEFMSKDQIEQEQIAYEQLGLLPPGTDMLDTLMGVLKEQVGGFYDPEKNTFFVLGDMPRSIAPLLVAHELTHALDDQHFGINALARGLKDDSDASGALAAVVEGSGTLVMSVFLMQELQEGKMGMDTIEDLRNSEAGRAEKLRSSPPLLQRDLLGPYLLGQTFILRGQLTGLLAGVKPADVNEVFKHPPRSSEQVLHPEKYWTRSTEDLPRKVSLPDYSSTLGRGFRLVRSDTMGEMDIAVLAGAGGVDLSSPASALPSSWTNEAASGWGGDRWQLYGNGEKYVTILGTVWDSPDDATEFEAAVRQTGDMRTMRRNDAVVVVAGAGATGPMLAQRACALLAGFPSPEAARDAVPSR